MYLARTLRNRSGVPALALLHRQPRLVRAGYISPFFLRNSTPTLHLAVVASAVTVIAVTSYAIRTISNQSSSTPDVTPKDDAPPKNDTPPKNDAPSKNDVPPKEDDNALSKSNLLSLLPSLDHPPDWSFPSLPSLPTFPILSTLSTFPPFDDTTTARIEEAWRRFPEQMTALKESYARWWDLIDVEQTKRLVRVIEEEGKDETVNPEIGWEARVRRSADLSSEEQSFLVARRHHIRKRFAEFIGVDEQQVHEEDVPIIGVAASFLFGCTFIGPFRSGGGCRAMVASAGYLKGMHESGMLDCVTYFAGISGSCWAFSLLYTPLISPPVSPAALLAHLRSRLGVNPASLSHVTNLGAVSEENHRRFVQALVRRYHQVSERVGLVDVMGAMLSGTLLTEESSMEKDEEGGIKNKYLKLARPEDIKISRQKKYFEEGENPMPIYCVVRHEVPMGKEDEEKGMDGGEEDVAGKEKDRAEKESARKNENYFQWFEFTPFEAGSEEFNAWVPTWSFGRHFDGGRSVDREPEVDLPIMIGLFGSAFAATLAHYYHEIRGLLPAAIVERADGVVQEYDRSLSTIHPISPASFPNPFFNLPPTSQTASLPPTTPYLLLTDAGLDNNIPFHPLLRPGRTCDVILALDMSADIQTAPWFDRAEGYVRRRGIKGWPAGAGWKREGEGAEEMGPCVVFRGEAREMQVDVDPNVEGVDAAREKEEVKDVRALTLVYLPLIANPRYEEGFDPQTSEYCSTWNLMYTGEQVDELAGLAGRNWAEGVDRVRLELRRVWESKRGERERREANLA